MRTSSATSLIVIQRSFITISFTFSTFSSVVDVLERPGVRHLQRLHGHLGNAYTVFENLNVDFETEFEDSRKNLKLYSFTVLQILQCYCVNSKFFVNNYKNYNLHCNNSNKINNIKK